MLIFAHRGSSARYPEHTRAAYREAIAEGADGIETDVRLTADGQLVCWHDASTKRVTGAPGMVHERTLADLRDLDVLGGVTVPAGYGRPAEQLMTLGDLLELRRSAGRPVRLALEIKQPGPFGADLDRAVVEALIAEGWDPSTGVLDGARVDIMCFWPQTIDFLRDRVDPRLLMLLIEDASPEELTRWVEYETGGVLSGRDAAEAVAEAGRRRDALIAEGVVALGPGIELVRAEPAVYAEAVSAGRGVRVWTVNEVEDALLCAELGIGEVTTDRPGELRAELAARQVG